MEKFKLKYGKENRTFSIDKGNLLGIIEAKENEDKKLEKEVVLDALANPIKSLKLKEIVNRGEKICIIISDITRLWQRMSFYLPYIVNELIEGGIKEEDIVFLCATGSHRRQTDEEHRLLLGEELFNKFKIIDHDCHDKDNLTYVGTTSYGTPVYLNKIALESDHIILTGAVVFHDLAGWGGGRKSILPGIAAYESIMKNHSLSLSPTIGGGIHPKVKCGNIIENPIHNDMMEAMEFVKPSFLFNVIIDSDGNIFDAVAGHYKYAHDMGRKKVDNINRIYIEEKADVAIVSAGGYPKDIDLYQASKALINAKEAVKEGGHIILLAQCIEGVGNKEIEDLILNYKDIIEREMEVRKKYTVAKFIGYLIEKIALDYNIILISSIEEELLKKINIKSAKTIEEALKIIYKDDTKELKTYIIPKGSEVLPTIE